MGSQNIYITEQGTSMSDAFRTAQKDAEREYGHDTYNGAINNCDLRKDVTALYNKANDKQKFLDDMLAHIDKRDVFGVCIKAPKPNKNKTKTKVTINPQKGTRKWETRYIAYNLMDDNEVVSEKTQGACVKSARAWVEKNQGRLHLTISKTLVKGQSSIGVVEYKQAKGETLGKYLFFGWAPI